MPHYVVMKNDKWVSMKNDMTHRCSSDAEVKTFLQIRPAMSTPLASIFGSGFLVIVPVLASSVGPYSVLAMLVVAFVAFQAGAVVRIIFYVQSLCWRKVNSEAH